MKKSKEQEKLSAQLFKARRCLIRAMRRKRTHAISQWRDTIRRLKAERERS